MRNINTEDFNEKSIKSFIATCFEQYGSMNKNDHEVALFHLLVNNKYSEESDFNLSRILQIPESKVKRLRYEANLKYQKSPEELKLAFYGLLKSKTYKKTADNKLQFSINDKMLRLYLKDKLDAVGSFADSSFNTSIMTISAADFIILIADFEDQKDLIKIVKNEIEENGKFLPETLQEKVKNHFVNFIGGMEQQLPSIISSLLLGAF